LDAALDFILETLLFLTALFSAFAFFLVDVFLEGFTSVFFALVRAVLPLRLGLRSLEIKEKSICFCS